MTAPLLAYPTLPVELPPASAPPNQELTIAITYAKDRQISVRAAPSSWDSLMPDLLENVPWGPLFRADGFGDPRVGAFHADFIAQVKTLAINDVNQFHMNVPPHSLLVESDPNLCLKCHAQVQRVSGEIYIGNAPHANRLSQGACWSAGCHTAVHGSNVHPRMLY